MNFMLIKSQFEFCSFDNGKLGPDLMLFCSLDNGTLGLDFMFFCSFDNGKF